MVAYPESPEDVDAILSFCADEKAAAIPFGGGTSVVGGVEPRMREEYPGVVSIDLKRMDRVLELDAVSRSARIQAGATGPVLEEQLRGDGFTLRHFPQSFEYSTLGGWIATRAGGHFATLYTHIDDLVESVRATTATGDDWNSRRLPGSGAGPSPDRMLLGSEGILGVITEAWVRVQPRPEFKLSCAVAFDDFIEAAAAVRAISQSGLNPANCRLLDALESETTGAGPPGRALLVLGFESSARRWTRRSRSCARTAAIPARSEGKVLPTPDAKRRDRQLTGGATLSSPRPTSATASSPVASSPTPSRPRSPGTASRTFTRR